MTLGEFCKLMVNESIVIKLYEHCNSDGKFSGFMCDTNKGTSIVEMCADKEIRAFKVANTTVTNMVCIALKMGEK